jgi:hypothetical protein
MTQKTILFRFLIFVSISSLLLTSCGESSENNTEETADTISTETEETTDEIDETSNDASSADTLIFKGFIGNSAITAHLAFDQNQGYINGYYYYDQYETNIQLSGGETDWYGGPVYGLSEMDKNGEVTGEWLWMVEDYYGVYSARFASMDGETDLPIIIKNIATDGYLDPASKMVFESQADAQKFFAVNKFKNGIIKNQSGIIVHEPTEEEYMEGMKLLPAGLELYSHDGGDGFNVMNYGQVTDSNTVMVYDGEDISIRDWEVMMEIEYEEACLMYDEVTNSEYVYIELTEAGFYTKIKDLNSYGYYLESDGHWLTRKSGNVLGFYPQGTVDIYEQKNTKSAPLLSVSDDSEGFFDVFDVVNFNNETWAKVSFVYFSEIPCDGTLVDPKPTVSGWIQLYGGDYKDLLKLGFYSRGC